MTTRSRIGIGAMMFAGAIGLVVPTFAQQGNGLQGDVKQIADALEKGNAAGAKKLADAAAKKYTLDEIMHLYRPRVKGGLGWGAKAGPNPLTDGLEKKVEELKKPVPPDFFKDDANNKEALGRLAALLEMTAAQDPPVPGVAAKKAWAAFAGKLRLANADLAKAVAAKDGAAVNKAATKINTACVDCHSKFKP